MTLAHPSDSLPRFLLETQPTNRTNLMRSLLWHLLLAGLALALIMPKPLISFGSNAAKSNSITVNIREYLQSIHSSGGSNHDLTPATRGALPQTMPQPIIGLTHKTAEDPVIAMEMSLPGPTTPMPNLPIGLPNGVNSKTSSFGDKGGNTIGDTKNGKHVGDGPDEVGIYSRGLGMTKPIPIYTPEPDFTDEARKLHIQGQVVLHVIIEPDGRVTHMRVLRSLGFGLDEQAMKAVTNWKFKPSTKDGKAIPVWIDIEVSFQLY